MVEFPGKYERHEKMPETKVVRYQGKHKYRALNVTLRSKIIIN